MALIEKLNAIGDAIREKNGSDELIPFIDMPQAILDIVSGGAEYENITFNEDNSITLTDKDGVEHTIECEYTDGKLTSVKFDEKTVDLTYEGEALVKVGEIAVDMVNVPINDEGEILLANAQFTSSFQNTYENENHNEEYQLSFVSDTLTTPTYCEYGLDHIEGGFGFAYSTQWENEFLNFNENTVVAMVQIAGGIDELYDKQRLFDFYPSTTSASHVGFSNGNLYKARYGKTSTTPSDMTSIEYNKWYVVSLVYRNGKYYTYLDDGLVATSLITDKETENYLNNVQFLNSGTYFRLNGYIKNLTYFNRALTSSEVASLAKTLLSNNEVVVE